MTVQARLSSTRSDEVRAAFLAGRCEASDRPTSRAFTRSRAGNVPHARPRTTSSWPEVISKEPFSPAVRQGDDQFADIVRWTLFAMIEAEEYGITSKNVDEMLKSSHPAIKRILGVTPGMGKALGVDEKWVYNIVKQVGNYGESFDRNLGDGSPLKIDRSLNELWTKGGHAVRAADPLTIHWRGGKTGREREQEPDHSGPTFGRLQVRNSLLHCRQDHSSDGRGATAVGRGKSGWQSRHWAPRRV